MGLLEVRKLHKSYAEPKAVDGVSFRIEAGEIFGLLGPNGAGKSTTINIIATILQPDAGTVSVSGVPLSHAAAYKRLIGYVPQEISLAEKLTARENLTLVGRLYDLAGARLRTRVDETLEAVRLADRGNDLVQTFSGGMKRRLNIAAALLHDPVLFLLDEPTAGVDPQARAYIFEIVENLAATGKAVLYTTHYMEEAQRLCRRTAIIDHGRLLAMGTLAELTERSGAKRELIIETDGLDEQSVRGFGAALGELPRSIADGCARFSVADANLTVLDAARAAEQLGLRVRSVRFVEPNLESVFLELTGRALRD